ncbi:MAG: hypothetical protein HYY40_11870 [Bacteroidetes bacterium]|nr:hypothetical protein [Bacteroidota bacterium]
MITWQFAIKKTIDLYDRCAKLEGQLESVSDAPAKTAILEKELEEVDNKIGSGFTTGYDNHQRLLELLTNFCKREGVILREFPKPEKNAQRNYSVETSIFVVEGNFSDLNRLIYELEQKQKAGKVSSVLFQTKEDYKTKRISLTATIYLQNVSKQKNS